MIGVRLLHGPHGGDPRELRDGLRLEIEHDATRDVVGDDRPVGDRGDLLEVADDPAHRRLVVVGRHDEEPVHADLVGARRQVDGVLGRVGPGARDHRRAVADLLDGRLVQLEALLVGEGRGLARRARDHEPVGAVLHEVRCQGAEPLEVD